MDAIQMKKMQFHCTGKRICLNRTRSIATFLGERCGVSQMNITCISIPEIQWRRHRKCDLRRPYEITPAHPTKPVGASCVVVYGCVTVLGLPFPSSRVNRCNVLECRQNNAVFESDKITVKAKRLPALIDSFSFFVSSSMREKYPYASWL
ncbi:uncharacterized protein EI90DRAFT_770990 [Cantharellus anzutake]|uniref:uncharacterized protein n=1 Tax=Cantharellus anzutake TaxID=1750568 RepID=UPI001908E903|nr:uncharacterized protein EI90DRAFT_770990 [Cantharellus anzutake]KAF8342639.1 hypothetical protein EI90DRAFT_770990 [Cantharellus anzutake]